MPKVHQQYFADEISLEKEARTFQLDDDLLQKINDLDGRAEENVIEIVKVNSVPLPVDSQKAVDVTVPLVQDSLDSTDPNKSLSAKQWKILYDYIVALQSRGRFLSSWNAVTGTPVTEPFGSWYVYNPGDYFVVTVVAPSWGTNYRPDWTVYVSWQASTVVETENIEISDMYIFDGIQWLFQKNTARQIAVDPALSTTSTNPVENRVVTNALNTKQNILTAGNNITIVNDTISATWYSNLPAAQGWTDDTLVTTWDKYNWDHKQNSLTAWANIQINWNVISATDTTYGNFPEAQGWTTDTLVTTWDKYNWNHKQDWLTTWNNVTIVNNTISADNDAAIWWNITWTLSDQTDLQSALDAKQDLLVAWTNVQINWNVISATDTKYTASDFDIKDLADSLNLRNTWNNKQDVITDLNTIRTGAAKWMTALQPGDNVSLLNNDAGYITKAVSDLTNYYNKNETYTKTEVDALIANFAWFKVVSVLPATWVTTLIYLLWPSANNTYEEYIYTENQWVKIWETTIDLSNYFHKVNDDSDDVIEGSTHLFMTPAEKTNLSHQSWYNTWDETKQSIETKLWAASATNNGYLTNADWTEFHNKQDSLLAWPGIQINGDVISASFVAWDGINISWNTISNSKPFSPGNTWSTWQVLKKTASWYQWANESWWGGWGWGWGWNFNPTNTGTPWQVLTKTLTWYEWANSNSNIKCFDVSAANPWQAKLESIVNWIEANSNNWAVLTTGSQDVFLYSYKNTVSGTTTYTFFSYRNRTKPSSSANGDYTSLMQVACQITYDGNTYTINKDVDYNVVTNFLVVESSNYTTPYMPTAWYQPATKAYVDSRNWVGTQAQYNALVSQWQIEQWVIYNIIPS